MRYVTIGNGLGLLISYIENATIKSDSDDIILRIGTHKNSNHKCSTDCAIYENEKL